MQRHDLPEGILGASCPYPGRPSIVLDRSLGQVDRNAVLAHELVHLERGGMCTDVPWREERAVEDEVARRLVPAGRLRVWVVNHEQLGQAVEPWMVAEEFRVPEYVATRALELLLARVRAEIEGDHHR